MATSQPLPSLPREVFNDTLYRSILRLWYNGLPKDSRGVNDIVLSRWFGQTLDGKFTPAEEKSKFDQNCFSVAGPALDVLGPTKYPLPPWISFEEGRRSATTLSAPIRQLITEDCAAANAPDAKEIGEGPLTKADITLAFTILLDQLPRNIFRDVQEQGPIYEHYDRLARALVYCVTNLSETASPDVAELDRAAPHSLNKNRRLFYIMPLMHSEWLPDHDMFSSRMQDLVDEYRRAGDEDSIAETNRQVAFEESHRSILERFGRYPHRNEALGRETTKEEYEYMEGGGETFGTKPKKG